MKIVCSKSSLLKSISISMKAVPSKTTMPILECILIDATANQIKFISNDMELGIETLVDGTVLEKGMVALDAKIFFEIIRKLPDNEITITSDRRLVTQITCEKAKFSIPGKSGEDFVYLPIIDRTESLSLSQFTLKEMISQTIFSISIADNNNPMMTGELFEIRNNTFRIVSLDGHRVSIRNMQLEGEHSDRKLIVPGKTLNELSKILTGELDSVVHMYFTANHILFEFDETIVLSRLLDGEYYRIDHMISNSYETKVVVNKNDLLGSIDRATLFSRDSDKKPIVVTIGDSLMELSISSALGSMNEEIVIDKQGRDMVIGFNPKFLIDALKVIGDENISLYMVNPKAPCFMRDDAGSYTYMILPVNIIQNQG